jgi:hypothetical protein
MPSTLAVTMSASFDLALRDPNAVPFAAAVQPLR